MPKVVVCGPESTGKTTLAKELAAHYHTLWVPEFAREYIGQLKRNYTYADVEKIAQKQLRQWESVDENDLVFFDTGLIITKVWFLEVFNKAPSWFGKAMNNYKPDLFLLCNYDIEWEPDPVRENGDDEKRAYLFTIYLDEIKKTGSEYQIVGGFNQERSKLAIQTIERTILKC